MPKLSFNPLTKVSEFRLKLYPTDFKKSTKFYHNILKFPIIDQWDRPKSKGVMFDTGSAIIELLWDDNPQTPSKPRGCDVSLEVKDVWKLEKHLKGKAQFCHKLRDNAWGDTSFCIKDPDGFEVTFFTECSK